MRWIFIVVIIEERVILIIFVWSGCGVGVCMRILSFWFMRVLFIIVVVFFLYRVEEIYGEIVVILIISSMYKGTEGGGLIKGGE